MDERITLAEIKAVFTTPQYLALLGLLTIPGDRQQLANAITSLLDQLSADFDLPNYLVLLLPDATQLTEAAITKTQKLAETITKLSVKRR